MFIFNIDTHELLKVAGLNNAAQKAIKGAAGDLAAMAHAHIIEEANKRLHTRREMLIENLSYFQVSDDVWIVQLDAKARWVNDGMPAHNMLDDLLKSPKAKTNAMGQKYINIPFDHSSGGATKATPAQQDLVSTIKAEMKNKKIPFGKIERNNDGSPKLGMLHSFDIMDKPLKTAEGVGQGKGPVGEVKQGKTGIPLLQGVKVFQSQATDKQGKSFTKKSIMTFRVAKEGQEGMWEYPGVPKTDIFENTVDWLKSTWEKEIAPQLMIKIMKNL